MEKIYYVVTFKPEYLKLLQSKSPEAALEGDEGAQRVVVAITQGGFGQDVIDDYRQVKERFLEYLYYSSDVDLPRTIEAFDEYFALERADEMIDLDEEI
jgi:hypothetical protein